ncbi:MAG: 2Fe-2S iron-sulfur cluster binding domain-containing protein [Verrucomicrobia bacterium]|nr:2Fe-2S iron-sulfur cluster binding domain-containing protein [Verrucomicrobiota bacterium]
MPEHEFLLNDRPVRVRCDDDTPLVLVLRDQLGCTDVNYACLMGTCGTCTIEETGHGPVRSCQIAMREAQGRSFRTPGGSSVTLGD